MDKIKYDLILEGKKEIFKNNDKKYYILKVDDDKKQNIMIDIFNNFMKTINGKHKHFMGIDFEFNKVSKESKDVALMQINLENDNNDAYIFLFNPSELTNDNMKVLIKLLTNRDLIKILHGAESLDVPYVFNQLLITKKNIDNFCKNFYDTKYLCEIYHIENKIKSSCSIYELLLEHKVISSEKIEELNKIEEDMGPIYLIKIDIHNLSEQVLKYSLYDVLFLPQLLRGFLEKNKLYTKITPKITCLIFKYKKNIEDQFLKLEKNINTMNIYFIKEGNNRILLKDIWEMYYYYIVDKDNYFIYLKEINYFKNFLEIITKLIVYSNIIQYFTVYKNNKETINTFNFEGYYDWINSYKTINKFIDELNDIILLDIKSMLKDYQ